MRQPLAYVRGTAPDLRQHSRLLTRAVLSEIGGKNDHRLLARPALRRAKVGEESRFHANRRDYTGTRHRGEHGDLQRRQYGVAEPAALRRAGAADSDLDKVGEDRPGAELGIGTGNTRF